MTDAHVRLAYASPMGFGKTAPWKPLKIPRPRPPGERRKMADVDAMRAFFGSAVRYVPPEDEAGP